MGIEENKALVWKAFNLLNQKKLDECFEFFAPGYIAHFSDQDVSLEESKKDVTEFFKVFSDIKITFELVVAEGDMVAVREMLRGTHTGHFLGIAPTGKQVKYCNTWVAKVADGKIAEIWVTLDRLTLMQQIGAIPTN